MRDPPHKPFDGPPDVFRLGSQTDDPEGWYCFMNGAPRGESSETVRPWRRASATRAPSNRDAKRGALPPSAAKMLPQLSSAQPKQQPAARLLRPSSPPEPAATPPRSGPRGGSNVERDSLCMLELAPRITQAIRVRHYSKRTEEAYLQWIARFIQANGGRHPSQLGQVELTAFISRLATVSKCSASTQGQALSALVFLYKRVLETPFDWLDHVVRAKRPERLNQQRLLPFVVEHIPKVECDLLWIGIGGRQFLD